MEIKDLKDMYYLTKKSTPSVSTQRLKNYLPLSSIPTQHNIRQSPPFDAFWKSSTRFSGDTENDEKKTRQNAENKQTFGLRGKIN